jgi:hypothetical protein
MKTTIEYQNETVRAESVVNAAFEIATSDNGGYNPWYCPYGCHTLTEF